MTGYEFSVDGETYNAPLGSLRELLNAGVVQGDLRITADGKTQTLAEALGPSQSRINQMPPSRTIPPATPFRPFVVLALVLTLVFTSWFLFEPEAGQKLLGTGPVRKNCRVCTGTGKTTCTTCFGSGRQATTVPVTQYRTTMVPVYTRDYRGNSTIRYEMRTQPYTVPTNRDRDCPLCIDGRRSCFSCLGTGEVR